MIYKKPYPVKNGGKAFFMALGLLVSFACETINHLLYQVRDDGYIKKSIEGQSHA